MREEQDILNKIEAEISTFTRAHKKVASYILMNPMQVAFSTVDQIAHAIGVSTTTVVRFTMTIGYTGFAEFQKKLRNVMQDRTQPASRLESNYMSGGGKQDHLTKAVQMQLNNIEELVQKVNLADVNKAADIILHARKNFIFGTRSGNCVAYYLEHNLNRIVYNVIQLAGASGSLPEYLMQIDTKDVLIVTSMPRYVKEAVTIGRIAKERGAQLIVISDGVLSPLYGLADIFFGVPHKSNDFHNAMTPSIFLCELIIDAITYRNKEKLETNLHMAEEFMHRLNRDTFCKG